MDKTLKTCFLLLLTIVPVFFCSCTAQELKKEKGKLLIVYLSRTNNTKQVAEIIQKEVGGDLVALELKEPYPENYDSIVAQVAKENESGYLPPLKTRIDNFNQYDKVFVGFPTWGMQLPPPMKSFLNKYNMSGKTVIPFNTNAGYGVGSSFKTVKEMCPNATVLEGFSTKGGIERDEIYFVMKGDKKIKVKEEIMTWLRRIKFL
ncbi:flavodoxin [Galbibacter orientalis DSM 19592]|uniref:Flavodoxin n=1 Tax=Galbibacter orientalis DSM 19592 TaxID=926559 RepID=I3CA86_9FLAO|nr:flavodoxin [Galbibacter orientalis]EIJ40529.1 flavodoxin [Galbibacter orientalis DSM 19592]